MQKAVANLVQKIDDHRFFTIDYLLIDGNFKISWNPAAFAKSYGEPKQEAIVKGDQKVFSIAAASIIAKVTRDRLMQKMHEKYPDYGFDKHKGYGTALHIAKIKELGASPIHRKSFLIKSLGSSSSIAGVVKN
jgi:ribonuclease HII